MNFKDNKQRLNNSSNHLEQYIYNAIQDQETLLDLYQCNKTMTVAKQIA